MAIIDAQGGLADSGYPYVIVRLCLGEAERIVAGYADLPAARADLGNVRERFWRDDARFYVREA
jgi:hypothetical protein